MEIKASTHYTYQLVRDYLWFNLCPRRNFRQILTVGLVGLSVLVAVSAATFWLTGIQIILTLGIILLAALLVLANLTLRKPRQAFRRFHSHVDTPNDYRFFEDRFTLHSDRTVDNDNEFFYQDVDRAFETDAFFVIYTSRRKGCVIGRGDFTSGDAAALRMLLQTRLGSRFKVLPAQA